jgi:thiosulfate dehydrogenase (quinone) large subunit
VSVTTRGSVEPTRFSLDQRGAAIGVAVLRVTIGLVWMSEAWWKFPPSFGVLRRWVERPLEFPVFEPYNRVVETVILPNFTLFGWLVFFTEAMLAAFLIVGLATRLWSLVGIAMTVPIIFSVLNYQVTAADGTTLGEWSWAYYMMLAIHAALFATAGGRAYGLDGVLRPYWKAHGGLLSRLLVRLS